MNVAAAVEPLDVADWTVGKLTDVTRLSDRACPKVVLDTNVLLKVHTDRSVRNALVASRNPTKYLFVVSVTVLAELASLTHPEAYQAGMGGSYAITTMTAAADVYTMIWARTPWPRQEDPPLTLVGFRLVDHLRLATMRHKKDGFLTWTPTGKKRRPFEPVPAMADHQVMAVALGLKNGGHNVTFATIDQGAATAARSRGILDEAFLKRYYAG